MEFTNLEPIPILVFSNLLMIAFLFLLGRKGLGEPYIFRPWRRFLMIFTSFLFCLFSFCCFDWFHYAEMYINLVYMDGFNTSLEYVYYLIANYLSPNYLVFRAIIWGGALFLLCLLFRHVSVRGDLLLVIFCALWLIDFGYGRVVLAYTIMYLGGSVLIKPVKDKMLLSLMFGGALLVISLFFHKSARRSVVVGNIQRILQQFLGFDHLLKAFRFHEVVVHSLAFVGARLSRRRGYGEAEILSALHGQVYNGTFSSP